MRAVLIHLVFVLVLLAATAPTNAGPSEGVMLEFRQVEEAIRGAQRTEEAQQAMLEANLLRARQQAVARRFHVEKGELLKELSIETMRYESPTSNLIYFVNYKDFFVRFDYARDPKFYIQQPTYEKFLIKTANLKLDKHSEAATETPAN